MPGQTPLDPPEKPVSSDRLDSWKEIAAYLKRDVRTVQRWEKNEKLPVHRHVHEKQGTVYSFKSQIDEWARGRRLPDEAEPPETLVKPAESDQVAPIPQPVPSDKTDESMAWRARVFRVHFPSGEKRGWLIHPAV